MRYAMNTSGTTGTTTPTDMGIIADTMQATLRELAQSDARLYRRMDQHLRTTRQLLDAADAPALPATQSDIALLEAHGYTVTR